MPKVIKKSSSTGKKELKEGQRIYSTLAGDEKAAAEKKASEAAGKPLRYDKDLSSKVGAHRFVAIGGKGMRYSAGGRNGGPDGDPFAMTKEEQDKSTAAVLKGDKKFMKELKKEERKTGRTIRRTGGGAEGLKKLQERLKRRTKRKRRREKRREKRRKWRASRTLNPFKAIKSRGRKKDFTGGQGKNAGCQGAACGAASTNKY